jgi:steroid delta-isomerase-like uncharacterized protein
MTDPASLARRYVAAWNARDAAAMDALFRPGHLYHDPLLPGLSPGPEGARQQLAIYTSAFPDAHVVVDDLIAGEGRTVVRWLATGTHAGTLKGLAATGRRARTTGVHVFRLARGQIAETWVCWDALGLFQQLGALPPSIGEALGIPGAQAPVPQRASVPPPIPAAR